MIDAGDIVRRGCPEGDRLSASGKIDVGCVGIGTDANGNLLASIASQCTPLQKRMAVNAGIAKLLNCDRLFINVDSNDSRFVEAMRTFIDVASSVAA